MDAWHRTFDQLRALFRGLSAAQRASLLVVSLGLLAGMGWLIWSSTGATEEFLLGGKSFTTEELKETQSALKSAGLTQFKVVGQRISVPTQEADRYTAAAIARQTLPAQFAAEFDRMQSKVNLFTSNEQRRELLEEARKTRLAQILRAIPEIEEAVVDWDRPRQANLFRPAPQLAAHVSVKPRDGRELSPELVQSLKLFVAGALAGAVADDVTVVDMNTSRVHGRRSAAAAVSDHAAGLTKQQEAEYSSQMTSALGYIPNVLVTVNVELVPDRVETDSQRSFVNTAIVPVNRRQHAWGEARQAKSNRSPVHHIDTVLVARTSHGIDLDQTASRIVADAASVGTDAGSLRHDQQLIDAPVVHFDDQSAAGYRKSVQVAVSIPEDYYAAVARQRGYSPGQSLVQDSAFRAALANIKAETQHAVREKLARLLPLGSDPSAVSVTTYAPLKAVSNNTQSSSTMTSELFFGIDLSNWMMGTGIAICSTCLFCVLLWLRPHRAMPPAPVPAAEAVPESGSEELIAESNSERNDEYPDLSPHPHAAVLAELAELDRRAPPAAAQRQTPFAFLTELAVADAARLLESEHPQTIALVATALAPVQAAEILHALPESLRWDVTQRLTRIGPAAPDVLCQVAASLQSRLSTQAAGERSPSPKISAATKQHESPITAEHPTPDEAVDSFTFDDLQMLDVRSLATVLESIDLRACAIALMDRSESVKQALLSSMPKHISKVVRQHLRQLGPVRLSEITAAQQAIAGLAWNLTAHGMIKLPTHFQQTN